MHNLDLHMDEFLSDIFETDTNLNEQNVSNFCSEILKDNND